MNKNFRFNLGYALAAIFAFFVIQHLISAGSQIAVIPYSEYQQLLRQGKVETVGISDRTLHGTLKEPLSGGQTQFVTTRVDHDLAQELEKYNVRFTGQIESTLFRGLLSWAMPVLLLFGIWWYIGHRRPSFACACHPRRDLALPMKEAPRQIPSLPPPHGANGLQ
jgi:cell division protease FtsH